MKTLLKWRWSLIAGNITWFIDYRLTRNTLKEAEADKFKSNKDTCKPIIARLS